MKINDEEIVVTRDEVNKYVNNPEFGFYLQCWQYTKLWGGINARGWGEWPLDILEGITAIEYEAKAVEKDEFDKSKTKANVQ